MNVFRSAPEPPRNVAPHFPIYLLPTLKIPFLSRRRGSVPTTAASNDVPSLSSSPTSSTGTDTDYFPTSPTSTSGAEATYTLDLPIPQEKAILPRAPKSKPRRRDSETTDRLTRNLPDTLRCNTCGTDVAYGLQIVSKGFTGRHGRALLVAAPPPTATPSCPGSPLSSSSPSSSSRPNANSYTSLARDGANLVNVAVGRPEPRALVTGAHVVADITCATCGSKIGWKYVDAREQAQKYKVGKFILETERVVLHRSWEDVIAGGGEEEEEEEGGGFSGHFYSASAPAASSVRRGERRSRRSSGSGSRSGSGGGKVSRSSSESAGVAGVDDDEEEGVSSESEGEDEVVFDSDDEDECEDIFAGVWDAATVARRRGSRVGGGGGGYSRRVRRNRAAGGGR
ncbi:hypothetical protein VPNG_08180 [Cytospora leucostoma]|uniref:Yippee domain-containing protein n=1 Tax=Cytospora leucostoma TaxID=1230097 RepID=A0A423WIJ7_9PEZI|nr:hypothetical protein VPNG_08180 [Cytospora leucostoma]